jgi:hypothetical protein
MENVAFGVVMAKLLTFVKAHPAVDFLVGFGFGILVGRILWS